MEEKNNERKKILLVIAVFIVLIAISVGGVYAYFSARATNSGSEITGRTLDINGTTLTIAASRVAMNPEQTPVSDDLVPANFGTSPTEITTTEVNRALTKQCSLGGYTGCHIWKVTATSSTDIPSANIKLNLNLNLPVVSIEDFKCKLPPCNDIESIIDESNWSYVVYTGTDSSSTTILNRGLINSDFGDTTTIDIHNGASLSANTPAVYYVMVYLNNTNSVQNDGITTNTTKETGTYNGTVILEAMGGQVYVNFYEPEATDTSFFEYEIENNEVTITGYKTKTAAYTVSDQSACESYFVNNLYNCNSDSECINNAEQICENGTNDWRDTLEGYIAYEDIPSNDYTAAGLSNVVITPAPTDVIIPSSIEGYPVTTIDGKSLDDRSLTSVVIPSSVTSIGEVAFYDNPLTSITIENENATIGNCAFGENPPLDEPFLSRYVCNP